jgi:hypothetical protein
MHDLLETEPLAVEIDRRVDVVDEVADADGCHRVSPLLFLQTVSFRSDTSGATPFDPARALVGTVLDPG